MKTETSMLLEHFGRYCMWYLPHMEEYVTEAQESGDVKPLLTYMEPWSRVDKVREVAAEIRRLEGIE